MSKYIVDLPDSFSEKIRGRIRVGVVTHNSQVITEIEEVIVRPKPYEEPETDSDKIEIGDEVFGYGYTFYVTHLYDCVCDGIDKDGICHRYDLSTLEKTGRKNDKLIAAMDFMKKEND